MSNARQRMVVTGREGQVALSLLERGVLSDRFDVMTVGRPTLDLARPQAIKSVLAVLKPDVIVSAAAYTSVDQAEAEENLATTVNAVSAGEIAAVADSLGVPIIHLSTDYVFDGLKSAPYTEADAVSPLGAYGRSKFAGEVSVSNYTSNHAILRTAWVYSPFGRNFLKSMLRVALERDVVNVVDDQIGNPTSALDIADAVIGIAANLLDNSSSSLRGTYHMVGTGEASWADFATEIFSQSQRSGGPSAHVKRIPTSGYPTPAKRPANSRLICDKLADVHGIKLPLWVESTASVIARLL